MFLPGPRLIPLDKGFEDCLGEAELQLLFWLSSLERATHCFCGGLCQEFVVQLVANKLCPRHCCWYSCTCCRCCYDRISPTHADTLVSQQRTLPSLDTRSLPSSRLRPLFVRLLQIVQYIDLINGGSDYDYFSTALGYQLPLRPTDG